MRRLLCCLLALMLCASGASAADRALSRFELHRYGEIMFDTYDVATLGGRLQLSVNGGGFRPVDDSVGEALLKVIDKYGMTAWDGFNGSTPYVLDGQGFRLEFDLTDGASVLATGDNAFPEGYFDAVGAITDILEAATPASPLSGIMGFLSRLFSGSREDRYRMKA